MDIINSFEIENETFYYYDISKVINSSKKLKNLPIVLKILLEANLRKAKDSIEFNKIVNIFSNRMNSQINFYPSRIIMQDFTGFPSLIDLASMRDTIKEQGGDILKVNPQIILDLVIDKSLNLDNNEDKQDVDIDKECEQNHEKYEFIKWAQNAFSNFRVIPPGSGICHQVNLEYLSTILHIENKENKFFLYPETIVGTDFHKTMINSIGVLGWGISGLDAQSAMLGLPISLNLPKVVGVNICGELTEGVTSSDLVLTLIKALKANSIDGKLVEFYGDGLKNLTLEDRSTISNMAPEYKAPCSFFAIDDKTISYFDKTRDNKNYSKLIKIYLEKQDFFYTSRELDYDQVINFDLSQLTPSIFGPKKTNTSINMNNLKNLVLLNEGKELKDADIVFASITSCISTSNPYLLIHAALIAKKALEFGLTVNKNVKTSLTPATLVVKEYLEKLDLLHYLEDIGFHIIGYGCNTSYEQQGELDISFESDIKSNNLNVCSITSRDKNFENSINPLVKSNYLMSPSLIIIYSLIGTMKFNLFEDVIGVIDDKDIKMKDLWPTSKEVGDYLQKLDNTLYKDIYKDIYKGNEFWRKLIVDKSDTYNWNSHSTFIQATKFDNEDVVEKIEINNAGILALLGDSISTDYISSLEQIPLYSPAAKYLESKGIRSFEYNTFESRRGNAEVMVRATFDNARLQNKMVSKAGGYTMDYELNEIVSIYEKAQKFKDENLPLAVFAGENYGIGTSLDWAVKGTKCLGIKIVIAKSFDENHRLNLLGVGVLPLEFIDDDIESLKFKGHERISVVLDEIKPDSKVTMIIHKKDSDIEIELLCRLDNEIEVEYYKKGGVLPYLLTNMK